MGLTKVPGEATAILIWGEPELEPFDPLLLLFPAFHRGLQLAASTSVLQKEEIKVVLLGLLAFSPFLRLDRSRERKERESSGSGRGVV